MRQVAARRSSGKTVKVSYVRRPVDPDDLKLCQEARTLLRRLDPSVLPIHLACRFPHVMNNIARPWDRPAHLDRYFDDLIIDKRGNRKGFPFAVAVELAVLKNHYQRRVYPQRECVWQQVYNVESGAIAKVGRSWCAGVHSKEAGIP